MDLNSLDLNSIYDKVVANADTPDDDKYTFKPEEQIVADKMNFIVRSPQFSKLSINGRELKIAAMEYIKNSEKYDGDLSNLGLYAKNIIIEDIAKNIARGGGRPYKCPDPAEQPIADNIFYLNSLKEFDDYLPGPVLYLAGKEYARNIDKYPDIKSIRNKLMPYASKQYDMNLERIYDITLGKEKKDWPYFVEDNDDWDAGVMYRVRRNDFYSAHLTPDELKTAAMAFAKQLFRSSTLARRMYLSGDNLNPESQDEFVATAKHLHLKRINQNNKYDQYNWSLFTEIMVVIALPFKFIANAMIKAANSIFSLIAGDKNSQPVVNKASTQPVSSKVDVKTSNNFEMPAETRAMISELSPNIVSQLQNHFKGRALEIGNKLKNINKNDVASIQTISSNLKELEKDFQSIVDAANEKNPLSFCKAVDKYLNKVNGSDAHVLPQKKSFFFQKSSASSKKEDLSAISAEIEIIATATKNKV
jgi:hypothetical protein